MESDRVLMASRNGLGGMLKVNPQADFGSIGEVT